MHIAAKKVDPSQKKVKKFIIWFSLKKRTNWKLFVFLLSVNLRLGKIVNLISIQIIHFSGIIETNQGKLLYPAEKGRINLAAKYEQLASMLKSELQQILRKGGTKLATEAELSERYHMSRQTVRHALELLEEEGLIERRQGSGSYIKDPVRMDSVRQIAVITTFLDDYIFPSILHDAQSVFSNAGYSTLVYATENRVSREREILSKLLEQKISAVLIEGTKTALPTPNADLYGKLRSRGIPVLFLHGIYCNLQGFPCLSDDNYNGGYQLAQYLLSKGHSQIAGIFKSDDVQGSQRYHGVVSALCDNGKEILDDRFFWYDTEDRAALINLGRCDFLERFIRHRLNDSTAVVCYNDEIAHFLIKLLLASGRAVPQNIAVVSFDNSFYSQIGPVPITSIGHKATRTGKHAAALLLEILAGKEPCSLSLEWELTCRSSA